MLFKHKCYTTPFILSHEKNNIRDLSVHIQAAVEKHINCVKASIKKKMLAKVQYQAQTSTNAFFPPEPKLS